MKNTDCPCWLPALVPVAVFAWFLLQIVWVESKRRIKAAIAWWVDFIAWVDSINVDYVFPPYVPHYARPLPEPTVKDQPSPIFANLPAAQE